MATTYKLIHTAEDVDYKLSLLEYGKNLLPYPYYAGGNAENDASISNNTILTDYGDGSILVHGTMLAGTTQILLDENCLLSPGVYTISTGTESDGFYLRAETTTESGVVTVYDEITTGHTFELLEQAHVRTFLVISTDTDVVIDTLTIKPQIERGEMVTDWKPYMRTVNNYIDNRFNGIKTKLATQYYTQRQIDTVVSDAIINQVKTLLAEQLTLGVGLDDKVYMYLNGEQIGTGVDVSILL